MRMVVPATRNGRNLVCSADFRAVVGLAGQDGLGVPALDLDLVEAEVEQEIQVSVVVRVLFVTDQSVRVLVGLRRRAWPEPHRSVVHRGRVERIGGQDGNGENSLVRSAVDGIGVASQADIDHRRHDGLALGRHDLQAGISVGDVGIVARDGDTTTIGVARCGHVSDNPGILGNRDVDHLQTMIAMQHVEVLAGNRYPENGARCGHIGDDIRILRIRHVNDLKVGTPGPDEDMPSREGDTPC